ncbi:MAG TPA: fibronectin type III domain-containing protein [Candidatus Polarisedimenticolaceae bacterium]|nr:fibronectin type III domain-containing protein [Candidatus Polarisedimenticolaceae bacterium]
MFVAALAASITLAAVPVRTTRVRSVVVSAPLPSDLVSPEGKSRWHLEGAPLGESATRTITNDDLAAAGAERWFLPDHDPLQMKMGARVTLDLTETKDGLIDRVTAEIATVGIGWVHLPSGPEEVVLERVLLLRQRAGERAFHPDLLVHRWVSPRKGVLASIAGPASSDGRSRLGVTEGTVVDDVPLGAADLKVYADSIYRGTFIDIKYGYDRGPGVAPSALVPNAGINNACDLVNLSTWDFSGVNSGKENATTDASSVPAESCNTARCGYQGYPVTGGLHTPILERLDRNLTSTLRRDNQVVQREDRATDVTFWLRAGTQNENVNGVFGSGESRFCFTDETGKDREEVPVWRMAHQNGVGWYTQAGDTWGSAPPAGCQETFYTTVCGASQPLTPNPLYGKACTSSGQTYPGTQSGKVVKAGVVITPSGHTLNAIVVRNSTEFCVYGDSSCAVLFDKVRTVVYYWEVPYLGSVALVRGPRRVDLAAGETETPCTNFTSFDFTDMGYGLYPPVSIATGAVTDTSIALSWNPGNDTHRISGYKIYWDTDPGASSNYAFNSVTNAAQASIVGTTATISGLTPGTTYYFTVTSLSSFTDPSSSVTSSYESIRYPTTVSGDPSFSYPVEVSAATTGGTCIPQTQVTNLTIDRSATPNLHVCWSPSADPCTVGYDILSSDDDTTDQTWTVAGQTGLTTCWDGDPGHTFVLVRARGTGGSGPWGHYNH